MSKPFQALLDAIIEDDRPSVKSILNKDPELATRLVDKAWLERRLPHWIYVGDTALHVAAAGYRAEIATILLKAGADVRSARNMRRSQPLHYASDGHSINPCWDPKRQVSMIRLLIDAGANIHAQDLNGATPLHRAVRTRCAAAVDCLLDAGADPKLKNRPGSTPFHLAVQNTGRGGSGAEIAKAAQRDIIRSFLRRGVSPKLKDSKGKSVSDWARSEWIRELLSNGIVVILLLALLSGCSLLSGCGATHSLSTHTLHSRDIVLSERHREDTFLQARLISIAEDGTTRIKVMASGEEIEASVGSYFVGTNNAYGTQGLELVSASKSTGVACLRRTWCQTNQ